MTTVAAIARVISAHAGIADVARWAKRLYVADMLPGLDRAATPDDVATLLLAVMAAVPDQAAVAVETLQGAEITRVHHAFDSIDGTIWDEAGPGMLQNQSIFDYIKGGIENRGVSPRLVQINVAEGGAWASVYVRGEVDGLGFTGHAEFRNVAVGTFPGTRRITEFNTWPLICALGEAFEPVHLAPVIDQMPSTLQH